MKAFTDLFALLAGPPAIIGLLLAALVIFLTSDRRLSLAALLVQYVLAGLTLTRFIEPEVAVLKIVVGILVVPILLLGTRSTDGPPQPQASDKGRLQILGITFGWDAGPLGLPLRVLAVLMLFLALTRLTAQFNLPTLPTDLAFVAIWMSSIGVLGLVLGGGPLRTAASLLTILAGFDLAYAILERSLAVVGLYAALTLLAGLAFSYLLVVQGLGRSPEQQDEGEPQ
jgi:hypothetical protein